MFGILPRHLMVATKLKMLPLTNTLMYTEHTMKTIIMFKLGKRMIVMHRFGIYMVDGRESMCLNLNVQVIKFLM